MPEEPKIFFHVGLGKVASTYLQKRVFPQLQGIMYISTHHYRKSKKIIPKLSYPKILVSREFDRQFEEEVRWFTKDYPNARIIMLLRRHDDWIASQYKRHVKNGFFGSFEDFLDLQNDKGYWRIKDLLYRPKLEIIKSCCSYPPLILFYEDFLSDPKGFLHQLTNYLGAPAIEDVSTQRVHQSFSDKQLKILRIFCRTVIGVMPTNHRNKIKHWLLYRPVWVFYHMILYAAKLFPKSWVPAQPLIDPGCLEEVRKAYEEDWKAVKNS